MALKPCLVCGGLSKGSYCQAHRGRRGSTRQWRKTRDAVFYFYGPKCAYCGQPATHVDHLLPVSRGGTDQLGNLRPACAKCNLAKGAD